MNRPGGVVILVVEDNPDHAHFTLKGLAEGTGAPRTYWVKDGEEALDFLLHRRRWADTTTAPRPSLILLDIHLPKLNGHEVLRHVKGDQALRSIPVIMLTTSELDDDVASTYRGGANSFVRKPVKFGQFLEEMKRLKEYWTGISVLPVCR